MNNADVRMKGFSSRSTVAAALTWVDAEVPEFCRLEKEHVSLFDAPGRVLAEAITSPVNVPAFRRAMMDGYALQAEATHGASNYNGLPVRILGTSMPGAPFVGQVAQRQAVRIMTGAPMPSGADAVLPAEQSEVVPGGNTVLVTGELSVGKHVGAIAEDIRIGDVVLLPGRQLRPQDVGVLSSIGVGSVPVVRRPTVRILITGNEVLPAGSTPIGFGITDANGPMLHGLVSRDGGRPVLEGIIADSPDLLLAELMRPADIILVSGGSSVGLEDHAPRLVAQAGTLAIHGVAMRPSSPTGMGRIHNSLVFLLPGNPVSCLCAYDFFAGRAIRAMSGREKDWPHRRIRALLKRKIVSMIGRVDYARVVLDGVAAEPIAIGGASILTSTTRADGFVIVPADSEGYPANSEIEVLLY